MSLWLLAALLMPWAKGGLMDSAAQAPTPSGRGPMPLTLEEEKTTFQPLPDYSETGYYDQYTPVPLVQPLSFNEMIERENVAYAQVLEVISGDTYRLDNGYRVKLVGVHCPKGRSAREEEEFFGRDAVEFARRLLRGQPIKLMFDEQRQLEDGTLLAYVFLANGRLVNEEMLLEGYATVDPEQAIYEEMAERFAQAQATAERRQLGMWAQPEAVGKRVSEMARPAETPLPEATAPARLTGESPSVELPASSPDQLILVTGERIEGRILGSTQGPTLVIETTEGNVIAVARQRIAEIKRR